MLVRSVEGKEGEKMCWGGQLRGGREDVLGRSVEGKEGEKMCW